MLTNNFLNLSKCIMLGSSVDKSINLKIKDTTNVEYFLKPTASSTYPNSDYSYQFTLSRDSAGWSVGSGSTPASINDYQLENTITSGQIINGSASVTIINDTENNKVIKRCTLSITNISNSDVTINEIGFKGTLIGSNTVGTASSSTHICLFYRHVLSESVVLEPTKAVSFIIDFYIDT